MFKKNKSSKCNVPSISEFQALGSAVMDDPESREALRQRLIALNGGEVPTDAKALATKVVMQAKASGVRKLPNRMMVRAIIESLFDDDNE